MGSILRPTKIADFFDHLCDAITDVIFFMCIDVILGCDIFEKKQRSIRCNFDCTAIAIRGLFIEIINAINLLIELCYFVELRNAVVCTPLNVELPPFIINLSFLTG